MGHPQIRLWQKPIYTPQRGCSGIWTLFPSYILAILSIPIITHTRGLQQLTEALQGGLACLQVLEGSLKEHSCHLRESQALQPEDQRSSWSSGTYPNWQLVRAVVEIKTNSGTRTRRISFHVVGSKDLSSALHFSSCQKEIRSQIHVALSRIGRAVHLWAFNWKFKIKKKSETKKSQWISDSIYNS